jgi:hypothetical protein
MIFQYRVYTASDVTMRVNDELEIIWKEAVVTSWYYLGTCLNELRKGAKSIIKHSQYPSRVRIEYRANSSLECYL